MSSSDVPQEPDPQDTNTGEGGETVGESEATEDTPDDEESEFTPQSAALRRQQYAVGVGAAIIAGFALTISSIQHFPNLHQSIPLVAGFVGAGIVYWIVQHSLFPTEEELPAGEEA